MQWICADKRLNNAEQVQFSSKISLWQRRAREDAVDREGKSKWSRPSDCLGAAIQVSDLPNGWLAELNKIFSSILKQYGWVLDQEIPHITSLWLNSNQTEWVHCNWQNDDLLFVNSPLSWLLYSLGSALMISEACLYFKELAMVTSGCL